MYAIDGELRSLSSKGAPLNSLADWQRRYTVVGLSFSAVAICYIDRVNISVAIIPMSEDLGWDIETRGLVLSSFAAGYILLQIVSGRLADRFGENLC